MPCARHCRKEERDRSPADSPVGNETKSQLVEEKEENMINSARIIRICDLKLK